MTKNEEDKLKKICKFLDDYGLTSLSASISEIIKESEGQSVELSKVPTKELSEELNKRLFEDLIKSEINEKNSNGVILLPDSMKMRDTKEETLIVTARECPECFGGGIFFDKENTDVLPKECENCGGSGTVI
jgi:hypothetical protein